jgi:hypothetical protein
LPERVGHPLHHGLLPERAVAAVAIQIRIRERLRIPAALAVVGDVNDGGAARDDLRGFLRTGDAVPRAGDGAIIGGAGVIVVIAEIEGPRQQGPISFGGIIAPFAAARIADSAPAQCAARRRRGASDEGFVVPIVP